MQKDAMLYEVKSLGEMTAEVERALSLLDSKMADDIIGEPFENYGVLIKATRSAMTMLWAMMKTFGLAQSDKSLRQFSQAMIVILTLVHYAYALGVKRGREEGDG
jgi:hypothetical protein